MKYIVIPPEVGPVPPITFDFAIEEFAARHFTDDDYCFIWQTRPTVIIGRNQLLVNEVNVDYCNANDVWRCDVFRQGQRDVLLYLLRA